MNQPKVLRVKLLEYYDRHATLVSTALRAQVEPALRNSTLGSGRIDDGIYFGDRISREAALSGVLANDLLIWRVVDAVDFVPSYVAVNPLNFRSEFAEDSAGSLRDGLEFGRRKLSSTWDFAFDYIFGHGISDRVIVKRPEYACS